jgi:DNA-binding NarL/FixJ family response regulator
MCHRADASRPLGRHPSKGGSARGALILAALREEYEGENMIRVLLVDDDAMYRRIFTLLLGRLPDVRVVAEAASLAEARTMLEGVDVAILDRVLPDGDGLELIGELREASPGVKTLVMSAFADLMNQREALEAGADRVLGKVESPEKAFAAIRQLGGEHSPPIHPIA